MAVSLADSLRVRYRFEPLNYRSILITKAPLNGPTYHRQTFQRPDKKERQMNAEDLNATTITPTYRGKSDNAVSTESTRLVVVVVVVAIHISMPSIQTPHS